MYIPFVFLKDFYKVNHFEQYPKGTELIFSNFTPRKSRVPGINHSVFFGLNYFIKEYLTGKSIGRPTDYGFYQDFMEITLHSKKSYPHIKELLELDYLPL